MNQVHIDGIVQDRIYDKTTPTGLRVVNFTVKNTYEGLKGPVTTFQQVVAWEPSIQIKSGLNVFIQGRLQTRSWQDKKSGQTKYTTEVVANSLKPVLMVQEDTQPSIPDRPKTKGLTPIVPESLDELGEGTPW